MTLTPALSKKIWVYLVLAVLCLPLFFLNITDGHVWGDDHAQYIKEAMNIAEGKQYYKSDYVFNHLNPEYGPPQYPPGFPLLLAPVVKLWGLSYTHMLGFIAFMLSCLVFILFDYFRKHTGSVISAACLSLLCVYSGGILELKASVISDIPCWVFTALYINMRSSANFSRVRMVLMVLVAVMAILIRSQALLIVAAEAGFIFITVFRNGVKKGWFDIMSAFRMPSFKLILGILIVYIIVNKFIFPAPASGLSYYSKLFEYHQGSWLDSIGANLLYFNELITRMVHYYPDNKIAYYIAKVAVYAITTFSVIGFLRYAIKRFGYDEVYYIATIALVIVLSQQQGVRFIIYILPMHLLYVYSSVKEMLLPFLNIKGRWAAFLITVFYLGLGFDEFKKAVNPPKDHLVPAEAESEAFAYLKENIDYNDAILFIKPRLLSLYTGKRAIVGAYQASVEENKELFEKEGVRYALISNKIEDGFTTNYINNVQRPVDTTIIADGYYLYRLW